ncbi:GTP 3',8-cyclase MoaA (plasmid) [Tistrella mobilis]|uniref:GTP 3',8-cyclase MoaA n=1 Tax=Tistrella mobilis TaxID=171437 RepID=UPI003557C026
MSILHPRPRRSGMADAARACPLIDGFGRQVRYLRLSVTDRCDLRCVYCLPARASFLPRAAIPSLDELATLADVFIAAGIRRIRLTGGEPLARRGVMTLVARLGRLVARGTLDELTLTTNGTQLDHHAEALAAAGVRRVNVSLDSLDPGRFAALTRGGRLDRVLAGIDAAQAAGLHVKLNTVALAGEIEHEIDRLIRFAHGRGMDLTLIEVMPLGDTGADRRDQHLPLGRVRADLARRWTLTDLPDRTAGPARYVRIAETGGRLGFITPLSHNFCESCDRVRVSAAGRLYTCLGHEGSVDLLPALRAGGAIAADDVIRRALLLKPRGHDFVVDRTRVQGIGRHMAALGG